MLHDFIDGLFKDLGIHLRTSRMDTSIRDGEKIVIMVEDGFVGHPLAIVYMFGYEYEDDANVWRSADEEQESDRRLRMLRIELDIEIYRPEDVVSGEVIGYYDTIRTIAKMIVEEMGTDMLSMNADLCVAAYTNPNRDYGFVVK